MLRQMWRLLKGPASLTDDEPWPSVGLAYELVKPSYDQVARRIDAQENRIRATMTVRYNRDLCAPTLLAGPLNSRDFGSPWFIVAIGAYGLLMLAAIVATFVTETRLVDPGRSSTQWLEQANEVTWAESWRRSPGTHAGGSRTPPLDSAGWS
jgi:hypothetical protein